ncbi:MAG: aldo/keto reductase [Candidatus Falkowbacteria bacterium]|nr:aldo/keto reductase [Candidatus Falkowbacteria bacterium]
MKTLSGKEISKIGIGSYGIGGRGHRDMEITEKLEDEKYVDALVYTLDQGINFTEIAVGYGHGQSLILFKKALDKSTVNRKDIFLTHSLYPRDLLSIKDANRDVKSFYEIMETDYADSTLVTQSFIKKFGEDSTYSFLHEFLKTGKTRFVSLSNASPECIRNFKKEFNYKFYAHEGHLSFEIRVLQDREIFNLCDDLGIKNIIWRPLRRNKTFLHNWDLLVELAEKYQRTQSQIVLNWLCNLGYSPMVMSVSQKHIDENIASTNFTMLSEDYERMNDFRPSASNYHPPKIDFNNPSEGDSIVTLVNDFENHYN